MKEMTPHASHSVAISSSVHDLSPTLWHALDVWRCTNHLSGGLKEALKALSHCGMGLVNESWYVLSAVGFFFYFNLIFAKVLGCTHLLVKSRCSSNYVKR